MEIPPLLFMLSAHGLVVERVGGVWRAVVVGRAVPPHLLLAVHLARDLRDVGARQHHRDQLDDGQQHADARVHDHHRDHVLLQLGVQHGHATVGEDRVAELSK